jgi:uncharacterized protein YndB with AHSA1/START domain
MKPYLLCLPLLALAFPAPAQDLVKVQRIGVPQKALIFEIDLPASLDSVWQTFATSEGLSTWLTPGATVDLREGGDWLARFPGGKTGGGTIRSFKPKREIVMSAMAPEAFPTVRAERTLATWQFQSVDANTTRLTLTQTGWKEGEEWNKAYEYLAKGNAQLLERLHRRFREGPVDWAKEWGPRAK